MTPKIESLEAYVAQLSPERKLVIEHLRKIILKNLPNGFEETLSYGMIGYVVPHKLYPNGYHCDPKLPLPFINLASQKNYIAIYHMGIYSNEKLLNLFEKEYEKLGLKKLNRGKSCIRFKKTNEIPYELIGKLCEKMTPSDWIDCYELAIKPKKK